MSHDLDESTGKPAMAYVGEVPWHGLGEQLLPGQPIEKWVEAARLDWRIQMLPVQYHFQDRVRIMPGRFVLARDDTGAALSVVSADYQVVQPKEILEFYRDLVEERQYTLETAGALDGGRKVWALAKTGLVANVAGNAADKLGAYVLLATSCDKSLATTATFTSIRVVCQNTLGFAFDDVKAHQRRHIKADHTKKFDPTPIKKQLGLIDDAWSKFLDRIKPMAIRPLEGPDVQRYFESLFLSNKDLEEGNPPSNAKHQEILQITSLFHSARGQNIPTAKDTLWGGVNAVTNYVDHVRPTKSVERIDSAWFGAGATLKEKAWQRAMELIESDNQDK
jgi:phage/plasmid-like protein (TIGR03299 family)